MSSFNPLLLYTVDSTAVPASYYGVRFLVGRGYQWTRDFFDQSFYLQPASMLPDPLNTTPALQRVVRGMPSGSSSSEEPYRLAQRTRSLPDTPLPPVVFRCVRPGSEGM